MADVDQDVREATEAFKRNALVIIRVLAHQDGEEAEYNSNYLDQMFVQAFARMKAAGREQGLREAAEVAREHGDAWGPAMRTPADQIASAITVIIGGGLDA